MKLFYCYLKDQADRKGAILLFLMFLGIMQTHGQTLHVMAYNIHHGCDVKEQLQLKQIASLIDHHKADIVGLVEVDSACRRSGNTNQPEILAKETGMHVAFVRHFEFQGGAYGLALLSRFPISDVRNVRLPIMSNENGDSTRALLVADMRVPRVGKLRVMVAHLDYRKEASRERQVNVLLNTIKDFDYPVMILGDLNAAPTSPAIQKLKTKFKDVNRANNLTFPSDAPSEKIDYIMLDKKHPVKTITDTVYPVQYSDHRPISATIKFLPVKNKQK